jgi:transcription antitermination factor NusG
MIDSIEPNCSVDQAWYALRTRHQHEKVAAASLSNKNFETFVPLYDSLRQWKGRKKLLSLPLFPCYIFLRGGLQRWRDVVTTPGVQGFVEIAGKAAVVSEFEIEAVRRVINGAFQAEPCAWPSLECGQSVRVKSGPLMGIEGILVRKRNQFRLVLSVEMLGKAVSIEVDWAAVEPVSVEPAKTRISQTV